ncbi:hypothetical protein BP6252_01593 [Coleophoma cylindrospora]|uniref:DUF5672 domain-containing protein n=1 Tax=Coleophoma cylindrospora TaxID=1849047 RepID=A0A3D8STR4_9HELO|nr:hypothetical protein BP6252_01593 [Coleophoma cylindrospora]
MTLSPVEDRRRKQRNIVYLAFGILIVIYTIKFSFPQHTALSVYQSYSDKPSASSPAGHGTPQEAASTPAAAATAAAPVVSTTRSHSSEPTMGSYKPPGGNEPVEMFNGTITNKAAIIIETRFRTNLVPLILHFSSVLGPSWPILIYTSAESVGMFSTSAALSRYLHSGLIQIRILPSSVLFTNSNSVNKFMTQKWLWESLAPAEHILIFQSDSMLCANAARSVEDFFDYDLVGAPIRKDLGQGYNGGLSLRKRSTILRVLKEWRWSAQDGDRFEDQWYYNRFHKLQLREKQAGKSPQDEGAINLPNMEIARTFSVETIDYPHPLGVHQVHRWISEGLVSLDEWCPEYKLCSTDPVKDT